MGIVVVATVVIAGIASETTRLGVARATSRAPANTLVTTALHATATANATAVSSVVTSTKVDRPVSCITAGRGPVLMAEDGGFEPPRACTQHAFQLRVPVFTGVDQRPSAQVNTGRPTRTDAPRRPRTRRNCNRNCNRSGAVVAPIRAAGLIGRSVFSGGLLLVQALQDPRAHQGGRR